MTMGKGVASVLAAAAAALVAVWAEDPPAGIVVSPRGGRVLQDGQMQDQNPDKTSPDEVKITGESPNSVIEMKKRFLAPPDFSFDTFKEIDDTKERVKRDARGKNRIAEGLKERTDPTDGAKWKFWENEQKYVDIWYNPEEILLLEQEFVERRKSHAAFGARASIEGAIVVEAMVAQGQTAAQFPLRCEGNLVHEPRPGGGPGGEPPTWHWAAWVDLGVDLDVDSDNNAEGPNYPPAETEEEDAIEADATKPGRLVGCTVGDSDCDGVPDWKDWEHKGRFVKMVLDVSKVAGVDMSEAEVSFSYQAADPNASNDPPAGLVRVWKKDGNQTRDPRSAAEGGDYVPPYAVDASKVFPAGAKRVELYVEGINPGADLITARFRPFTTYNPWMWDEVRVSVLKVDFLKNDNSSIDPTTEALNVANYVTTDGLPKDSATVFATTCNDPDNFRIEVDDASVSGASVDVKLQVNTGAETTYTLNKKNGSKFRGLFMRLVTDANDDAASEHGATSDPDKQTVLVALGDTVRVKYEPSPGVTCTRELQVGRPKAENDNGSNQLKHDIRELKLKVVVFRNQANNAPAATRAAVEADIATVRERLAQATVAVNLLGIDMGGTGDPGVALPTALGNGFTRSNGSVGDDPGEPTADETGVVGLKDSDGNSIDLFYVDELVDPAGNPVRASAYPTSRNLTGNAAYARFIVFGPTRTVLSVAHETLHILLNSGHRADPTTALFRAPTSSSKIVSGTKRIGPYPDAASAGVGNGDTQTIRPAAESLP